ncbi:hypothetical protein CBR_g16061 [Chara braunii]|uniref:Zinc finger PHD-type domain-containing protein n=1 Tax=Chara braunii TaxID=69332 RepID=A0A388JSY9_CHABU|nr:hypothetical protein CBR_g16061 [Chara braunii]|eukprot:GBG60939.1 hypothetical protein CBR_g16061 [Chara braunii]
MEEDKAKQKQMEEELQKWKKEQEEKLAAIESETEEEEVEVPLERRGRTKERGKSSGARETEAQMEVKAKMERLVNEWVANLALGKEDEALLFVPQAEREQFARDLEGEENPMKRQVMEEEKKLEWKLGLARGRKRRLEADEKMEEDLREAEVEHGKLAAQIDLQRKVEILSQSVEVMLKAQQEQLPYLKGHGITLQSMRTNFKDFAKDMMMHVGTELRTIMEGTQKFCVGAIKGAKIVGLSEEEARPRRERVKVKFRDHYSGKVEEDFDNWEANVNSYVHLQDIAPEDQVLEKLREANFKINAKKCEWAKTQVLYLGHVLDGDGIKPEDSKIAAIRDWPTPRTLTELLSFLGSANYYRKFVRNFSTITAPLRKLLKKEAIWKWDKDCTSSLKKLKRALIEYPILKVADPSLPFIVTTDASQYGVGTVLQQDDGNRYRPVEFMSARMPSEKVTTSTYERELYALRQALDHWKHYLLGRHFKVYPDHETPRWLKTQAKMTPKLTRWAAETDQFDFELKPVKGKYNVVADALRTSTSPVRSNSCERAQGIDDCRISCDVCLSNNSDSGGGEVTLNGIFDEEGGRCRKGANESRGSETMSRVCADAVCAGEGEREGGGSSMGPREHAGVCPEDFPDCEAMSVARSRIRRKRVVLSSDDEDCREGIDRRRTNSAHKRSASPEDDNQNAPGDWLCMICDDGGSLTQCDGCDRCVHLVATDGDGNASLPCMEAVKANYKVFRCNEPYCGYFYHRKCLRKWARRNEIEQLQEWRIPFRCPVHHCQECRKEGSVDPRNPLIMCRRCPKAWHFKCLPKELACAADKRVWGVDKDGPVASEPMLLYCMSHDLLPMGCMPPQYIKFEVTAEVIPTKTSKKFKKINNP